MKKTIVALALSMTAPTFSFDNGDICKTYIDGSLSSFTVFQGSSSQYQAINPVKAKIGDTRLSVVSVLRSSQDMKDYNIPDGSFALRVWKTQKVADCDVKEDECQSTEILKDEVLLIKNSTEYGASISEEVVFNGKSVNAMIFCERNKI